MINIEIADVNFTIHCSDASLLSEPQSAAYAPFIINQPVQGTGSFTIDVQLEIKDCPYSEGLTEIFQGNGSWSMFRKGGEYYLSLNPSAADGSECITCFELPLEKAIVYCAKMDISEAEGKRMVRGVF